MNKPTKKKQQYTSKLQGVAALLGGGDDSQENKTTQAGTTSIAISQIQLPLSQPRRYFDLQKLTELSNSIKELGILEPLLVRPLPKNKYELVAGERRFKAAQMAELTEVPAIVREMDDNITRQVRLVENLQREDLNPLEETEGILELLVMRLELDQEEVISYLNRMRNVCDRHKDEDSEVRHNVMSQTETKVIEELFTSLGRMGWDSFVKNRLPLLKLPPDVLFVLRQGKLEYTKARAIGKVKDDVIRKELLEVAIEENLSLNEIKQRITTLTQESSEPPSLKQLADDTFRRLKQSKVWDEPKKKAKIEKLLSQMEALMKQ